MIRFIICLVLALISYPIVLAFYLVGFLIILFLLAHSDGSMHSSGGSSVWKGLNFFNVYDYYKRKYNSVVSRISTFVEEETK